ncbi:MAG: tyrosine-type recombinase/integrase [Pyramidobacter sp.]|nr:tyrosine-type recombinase/integrase [Pyramidobacter sp.]
MHKYDTPAPASAASDLVEYADGLSELLAQSIAVNTRRAYLSRFSLFSRWAQSKGQESLPATPKTVAAYIVVLSEKNAAAATLNLTLAAIAAIHRTKGFNSPTESELVKRAAKGYRRRHGTAPHRSAAATLDVVKKVLEKLDARLATGEITESQHHRDAALFMLGFTGAFRRSELAALDVEDLRWSDRSGQEIIIATLRHSKTDQEGHGQEKVIFSSSNPACCPVRLLRRWLQYAGISSGPIFRAIAHGGNVQQRRLSNCAVSDIIKQDARLAVWPLDITGHSLRAGFVTSAIRAGRTERSIMNQTGHRSPIVLREYFRRENAIEDNAADGLVK